MDWSSIIAGNAGIRHFCSSGRDCSLSGVRLLRRTIQGRWLWRVSPLHRCLSKQRNMQWPLRYTPMYIPSNNREGERLAHGVSRLDFRLRRMPKHLPIQSPRTEGLTPGNYANLRPSLINARLLGKDDCRGVSGAIRHYPAFTLVARPYSTDVQQGVNFTRGKHRKKKEGCPVLGQPSSCYILLK